MVIFANLTMYIVIQNHIKKIYVSQCSLVIILDPIIRHALTQSVLNFQLHAFVNNSSREFIEENLFEKGPVHLWAPINSGKIKIRVKHNFLSYNIY